MEAYMDIFKKYEPFPFLFLFKLYFDIQHQPPGLYVFPSMTLHSHLLVNHNKNLIF